MIMHKAVARLEQAIESAGCTHPKITGTSAYSWLPNHLRGYVVLLFDSRKSVNSPVSALKRFNPLFVPIHRLPLLSSVMAVTRLLLMVVGPSSIF
jgi:hypothetical protein